MVFLFKHLSKFEWLSLLRSLAIVKVEVTKLESYFFYLIIVIVLVYIAILVVKLVRSYTSSVLVSSDLFSGKESPDVSLNLYDQSNVFH
jgi:hypothetical protein